MINGCKPIELHDLRWNFVQILMFPEGTDKTAHTTSRSDQFADREGLPRLRHVLYPRSAGFVHLTQKMRERKETDQ